MIVDNAGLLRKHHLSLLQRITFPIFRGPNAGLWWSPSCGSVAAYSGRYRLGQLTKIEQQIDPFAVVWDVGAGCGYFSLMFARLAGSGGVLSVESNASRAAVLQHHIHVNRLSNVRVLVATVAGSEEVKHKYADCTLDDLLEMSDQAPTHIRLAISRDQLSTLEGGAHVFELHRPVLFLSTDGRDVHHRCCKWLAEKGYQLWPLTGTNVSNAKELICTPSFVASHTAA